MAVDRGCYMDQSQSLNINMDLYNFTALPRLVHGLPVNLDTVLALCAFTENLAVSVEQVVTSPRLSESHDKAFNQSSLYKWSTIKYITIP